MLVAAAASQQDFAGLPEALSLPSAQSQHGLEWFIVNPQSSQLSGKAKPQKQSAGSEGTEMTSHLHSASLRWLIRCYLVVGVRERGREAKAEAALP